MTAHRDFKNLIRETPGENQRGVHRGARPRDAGARCPPRPPPHRGSESNRARPCRCHHPEGEPAVSARPHPRRGTGVSTFRSRDVWKRGARAHGPRSFSRSAGPGVRTPTRADASKTSASMSRRWGSFRCPSKEASSGTCVLPPSTTGPPTRTRPSGGSSPRSGALGSRCIPLPGARSRGWRKRRTRCAMRPSSPKWEDREGARELLMEVLCTDLRCIDAHAHLGNLELEHSPERAMTHYEMGIRIGELSLPPGFDGVLVWGRIYNRPFLRCLYGHGLCPLAAGKARRGTARLRARPSRSTRTTIRAYASAGKTCATGEAGKRCRSARKPRAPSGTSGCTDGRGRCFSAWQRRSTRARESIVSAQVADGGGVEIELFGPRGMR